MHFDFNCPQREGEYVIIFLFRSFRLYSHYSPDSPNISTPVFYKSSSYVFGINGTRIVPAFINNPHTGSIPTIKIPTTTKVNNL